MPDRRLATTRRTALVVTAGLGLAACTSGSPDDPDDPAGPADSASTSAPPADADQELVDEVVELLTAVVTALGATRAGSRPLARELRPLERMHLAHLEALGVDETRFAYTPNDARTRREVFADELRLQRFFATAAVSAESGTLARLLASMSAAVAQHLAVLG